MFKKVSVFVNVRLRREMERAGGALGIISPGFSRCMDLVGLVTKTAYGSQIEVSKYLFVGNASKYFDGWHDEFGQLREVVQGSDRLEFVIKAGPRDCTFTTRSTFAIRFCAFRKAGKIPFYELEFLVSFSGEISVGGFVHRSL